MLMKTLSLTLATTTVLVCSGLASATDAGDSPRPVPLTRLEMKQAIEDMKDRKPRIPFPELSEEDREALGERADDYESALRQAYLPWVASQRRSQSGSNASTRGRTQDPRLALDPTFKTELFWIVSRVNNCQYCIGHQESKLLAAGRSEDEIAALDGDWASHSPAERAAFAYARKLSYEPHLISDADIEALRQHYSDLEILEMTVSIGRNQIMNRSHEAVGAAQRRDEGGYSRSEDPNQLPRGSYLTPTSDRFRNLVTTTAPVVFENGAPTRRVVSQRPPLESWSEVEKALEACRTRKPRLPLVDEATARRVLGENAPEGALPAWILLLANFPSDGVGHVNTVLSTEQHGDISPLLKAQLAWIVARQDRAWYAAAEALARLRKQGQSDEQIQLLDGDWKSFSDRDRALFRVAKKLAASPVVLTDSDVANAVSVAGPRDTVQAMNYATIRSFFNRVTEAAGLPCEN